jgi:hypothetical protein
MEKAAGCPGTAQAALFVLSERVTQDCDRVMFDETGGKWSIACQWNQGERNHDCCPDRR